MSASTASSVLANLWEQEVAPFLRLHACHSVTVSSLRNGLPRCLTIALSYKSADRARTMLQRSRNREYSGCRMLGSTLTVPRRPLADLQQILPWGPGVADSSLPWKDFSK